MGCNHCSRNAMKQDIGDGDVVLLEVSGMRGTSEQCHKENSKQNREIN